MFAFSLDLHNKPKRAVHDSAIANADAVDFDRSGRVDILDAFVLAKQIDGRGELREEWDFNADGVVDRADVDSVALAAVSLERGS